jgi:hypothetical protein
MAKRDSTDRDEYRGVSAAELRELQAQVREAVLQRVQAVDPKTIGDFQISLRTHGTHFSDWHDRFRDGGGFADTWGKAGDLKAQLRQRVGPEGTPEVTVPDVIPEPPLPEK